MYDIDSGMFALLWQQIMFAEWRFHGWRAAGVDSLSSLGKHIVTVGRGPSYRNGSGGAPLKNGCLHKKGGCRSFMADL